MGTAPPKELYTLSKSCAGNLLFDFYTRERARAHTLIVVAVNAAVLILSGYYYFGKLFIYRVEQKIIMKRVNKVRRDG